MQIERFEVKGFKNLRQSVVLDELGGVNVIHGENNVGKSNLLQAMDLFFWLLGELAMKEFEVGTEDRSFESGWVIPTQQDWLHFAFDSNAFPRRGYAPDDIFNLDSPAPIEWNVRVRVDASDLRHAGFVDVKPLHFSYRIRAARNPINGVDVSVGEPDPSTPNWEATRATFRLIARNFEPRSTPEPHAFVLVDTHRRVAAVDRPEEQGDLRSTVPADILLALYDAKESVEPGVFERWSLFEESMNSLGLTIDNGRFVITYNRPRSRAVLALQNGRVRVPVDALGSGIQQLSSLLARLLLGNSAIVAIEEPELNLRYDLQLRLRDILAKIVATGTGPRQIILTSHSPAFETGESFYAMTRTSDGPTVARRPVAEAALFTQQQLGVQLMGERAAMGYVSSDGLVRLSEKTRKDLGVEHGGGVVMLKRDEHPYVEILTNEQFQGLMRGEDTGNDRG